MCSSVLTIGESKEKVSSADAFALSVLSPTRPIFFFPEFRVGGIGFWSSESFKGGLGGKYSREPVRAP